MKRLPLLVLTLLMLTACSALATEGELTQNTDKTVVAVNIADLSIGKVWWLVDKTRGVECWIFDSRLVGGGISCIPSSEFRDRR